MIICITGGIGSGKTLSVVKEILDKKQYCYTNFKLKKMRGKYHRIKYDDLIKTTTTEKPKKSTYSVNWDFWDKAREKNKFSIYLDEVHNIAGSRNFMSKENKIIGRWLSQIRKIFYGQEHSHLYLISQNINHMDVYIRRLAHLFIHCVRIKIKDKIYIIKYYYASLEDFEMKNHFKKTIFLGNPYFNYYDTYELVSFGDQDEYI